MLSLRFYIFLLLFGIQTLWCVQAQQYPELKNAKEAVQDYIQLLSETERMALNNKLRAYADSTSTGIVIAITKQVADDINFEAAQLVSKWGIGQKGKNNGVLILMAYEQRKVAISTGYGIESYLTDALSKQIITTDMLPNFKQGNYYQGFDLATTSIMQVLSGTYKQEIPKEEFPILGLLVFIALIVGIIYIIYKMSSPNSNGGNYKGSDGLDLWDMIILSNMGRSSGKSSGGFGGFGGFGGGSGGFGGFGGGMGGGGGASGSW
ncbi:TPM domain-containing protein [Capnocytophaga catalasegens]|uniref:TPM domain-containing protein n=1 Tax=Capnocytophaga catalasegens TaxID=1004260 RepID=A0AAV5B0X0_9FLAO|nr:TPM domain-containing protein [Capnocytophaga catalasegens]GIZ16561.1 hypothetical protein RCZ03_25610 [Capnocytophaga catalasegens]GJM51393.1 hypothetical protein RCZ15_23660 [Capnocytophaga catalasegens]GJM54297.1 hypothetical protein RCZ16_26130 [Capnocytophaga catalasegens]